VIEYDDSLNDAWYPWHDVKYAPDYFFAESMKKGYGIFDHAEFKGKKLAKKRHGHRHD